MGSPATPTSVMGLFGPNRGDRYRLDKHSIGTGAFGTVYSARDRVTGQQVAVKNLADVRDRACLRMLIREIQLLQHLSHPNVLQATDIQLRASAPLSVSVRMVTPLYDATLTQVLRVQSLHVAQRKHILTSICRGLAHMHAAGVVHRDVKPANIFLNADLTCVIGDLGFSRFLPKGGSVLRQPVVRARDASHGLSACTVADDAKDLSEYVVTRWYRAPELLVYRPAGYDAAVDCWSVGCVLAEMIRRTALFTGADPCDQLTRIVALLGQPADASLVGMCGDVHTVHYVRSVHPKYPVIHGATANLAFVCGHKASGPEEISLLRRLLEFDPARRLSMALALGHPFLKRMHEQDAPPEVTLPPPHLDVLFAWDRASELDSSALRRLAREEVARFTASAASSTTACAAPAASDAAEPEGTETPSPVAAAAAPAKRPAPPSTARHVVRAQKMCRTI